MPRATRTRKTTAMLLVAALFAVFLFSVGVLGGEGPRRESPVTPPWNEGAATMDELRAFFPHGKFWNHVVGDKNEAYSVTDTACSPYLDEEDLHDKAAGVTCNYFEIPGKVWGGWQCCGYARLLTYSYYGSSFENWETAATLANVKAGDVLYVWNYGPHYVWILSLKQNGDGTASITYADCNGTGKRSHCQIQWDALGSLDLKNNVMKNPLLGDWALKKLYRAPKPPVSAPTTTVAQPRLSVNYHLSGGTVRGETYEASSAGVVTLGETGVPLTDAWTAGELLDATFLSAAEAGIEKLDYRFVGWSTHKNDTAAIQALARAYPVSPEQAAVWFTRQLKQKTRTRLNTALQNGVRQVMLYAIWIPEKEEPTAVVTATATAAEPAEPKGESEP